jgi:hypothetical protein
LCPFCTFRNGEPVNCVFRLLPSTKKYAFHWAKGPLGPPVELMPLLKRSLFFLYRISNSLSVTRSSFRHDLPHSKVPYGRWVEKVRFQNVKLKWRCNYSRGKFFLLFAK